MDDRAFARYDKFGRVLTFGRTNLADVAATDAAQHLDKLDNVIKALDRSKAGQQGGERGEDRGGAGDSRGTVGRWLASQQFQQG